MKKINLYSLLILSLICTSCSSTRTYQVEEYRTTMKFHDNFKIMQITDVHLGIESNLKQQLEFITNSIKQADPDLIIFTGDNFMYGTKGIVKNFLSSINDVCKELSQSHQDRLTKFAITYGNHDNQGDYHRYYINEQVKKYTCEDGQERSENKYCAFIDFEDDDLPGLTNYYIDLVDENNSDDVKYRLHIIDSNTYRYIGFGYDYDIIYQKQAEHALNIYQSSSDKDYIGLAFFHIPFTQYDEAITQFQNASNPSEVGRGEFAEPVSSPTYNNLSYSTLREANILAYFVGHDHVNMCDIIYNANDPSSDNKAIFSYGVKSTNQLYHDCDLMGYKLINLEEGMSKESFLTMDNINRNFINVTNLEGNYDK